MRNMVTTLGGNALGEGDTPSPNHLYPALESKGAQAGWQLLTGFYQE